MQFLDTYVKLIQVGQDGYRDASPNLIPGVTADGIRKWIAKVRLSCLGYFESFDASFLSVYCKL